MYIITIYYPFHTAERGLMGAEPLQLEGARAYLDQTTCIVHVMYRGTLMPEVTVQVHRWLADLFESVGGVQHLRGMMIDYRGVRDFHSANLSTTQRQSRALSARVDLSRLPIALIVTSLYQEQMVRVTMKTARIEQHARILRSIEEAHRFIESFRSTVARG